MGVVTRAQPERAELAAEETGLALRPELGRQIPGEVEVDLATQAHQEREAQAAPVS